MSPVVCVFNSVQFFVFVFTSFSFFCFFWKCIFASFCTLWWWFCIKMANWGAERDQSSDSATLQQREVWCICMLVWQHLYVVELVFLYGDFVLYFCICEDAECSSDLRGKSGIKLWGNYAAIQATNQPASIILHSLYTNQARVNVVCAVCPMLEKISESMWGPKVFGAKRKTSFNKCHTGERISFTYTWFLNDVDLKLSY